MTVSIRRATNSDIPVLRALVESAYRGDSARGGWTHEADLLDGQRTDIAMLAGVIEDPDQCILLAEDAGTMVGCVQVSRKSADTSYLGLLTVDPSRQAGGLGRVLISAAEEFAKKEFAARRMEMTVIRQRDELIEYYQRRGYATTGEERPFPMEDPRFGLPKTRSLAFVVMARKLD